MEAARAWGVSPSVLAGRVVEPGEPVWTQEDTDIAVALTVIEATSCPGCGHPRDESFAPANEEAYKAEALRCYACAARDRAAHKVSDSAGLYTVARRLRG